MIFNTKNCIKCSNLLIFWDIIFNTKIVLNNLIYIFWILFNFTDFTDLPFRGVSERFGTKSRACDLLTRPTVRNTTVIQNGEKIVFGSALGNGQNMIPKLSKNDHPWPGGPGDNI